ncbi:MAG: hypothetical protein IH969_06655, partial [Candidatus Krumholzibacteriota bacterium]|nr:hypothetical protein [Candidatus Krumholzibacteriota bacterium]
MRLNRELTAMVRIASAILRNTELDSILAAITGELSRIIDFDRSSVALMSRDKKTLVLRHIHKGDGDGDKIGDGRHIPLDEKSIIGWVALHRSPILRRNIETDGRFLEVVKEEQLRSDMGGRQAESLSDRIRRRDAINWQRTTAEFHDVERLVRGHVADERFEPANQLLLRARQIIEAGR